MIRARSGPSCRRGSISSASPGIAGGDLCKRIDCAWVALDRNNAPGAIRQKCAREAARAGPDFDHCDVFKRLGSASDAGGQVEVEQEILTEGFFGRQAMLADDLPQRRQVIELCHYFAGTSAGAVAERRAASDIAAIRLEGSAVPLPAISKAVPWSGDVRTNGKPSVTLTA